MFQRNRSAKNKWWDQEEESLFKWSEGGLAFLHGMLNMNVNIISSYFISAWNKDSKQGQKTSGKHHCVNARLISLNYREYLQELT